MDALGKSLIVILAVAAAVCIVPMASDSSDGYGDLDGVLIYEVNPWNNNEGVSLCNYGSTAVNLRGYWISDSPTPTSNEGYLEFTGSVTIQPGAVVVVASSEGSDPDFVDRDGVTVIYYDQDGSPVTKQKSFTLSNSGDDIYLWDSSGKIIDAVCYGNKTISDESLWFGDAVSVRTNVFIQRHGSFDTDSSDDWFAFIPGQTNLKFDADLKFEATVTPFLFPDSGGIPVYQALESADDYVYITIYQLSSVNVYALLCDLADRGVEVKLLMEGESLTSGGDFVESVSPYLQSLLDHGAEVRLIGVGDDDVTDRYSYVHAKYAVIDGDTVVVTSENWTTSNMNGSIDDDPYRGSDGNRGWGAVVESQDYASYMLNVFNMDYSMSYGDVKEFSSMHPEAVSAGNLTYSGHDGGSFESYTALVTPVLSSDNSYEALEYYIDNATTRVYTEQQSLGTHYQDLSPSSPVTMMNKKAQQGVECIAVFDDTSSTNKHQVYVINSSSLVSAALMDGSTTLHNKGVVCDDISWVSSINWTDTSFNYNREVCVVIESAEIADYFADCILRDFNQYYDYDGFSVVITEIEESYTAGQDVTFAVTVSPSGNYSYRWDLGDGSEPIVTDEPRIVCSPVSSGDATVYTLTVTVTNLDDGMVRSSSATYTILAEGSGSGGIGDVDVDTSQIGEFISDNLYILAPIILIILALIAAMSRAGSKSKKSKKRK